MAKLTKEQVNKLLDELQNNIDGGFVWDYVNKTTNLEELMQSGHDSIVVVSTAAFFAGVRFALENTENVDD